MNFAPDKKFDLFLADIAKQATTKNRLDKFINDSELWFYDEGMQALKKRAGIIFCVDDASPEEVLFAKLVYKHFPELNDTGKSPDKVKTKRL